MIKNYSFKKNICNNFTNIRSVGLLESKKEQDKNILLSWMLTFMVLTALLFSNRTNAQTTIPAANTNTGFVNDPLGTYYGYERTALIYSTAEIGTTGNINKVGFYLNAVATPGAATNVRVYMKLRAGTMGAASTYLTETTGATLVYGPTTIPAASFVAGGWITIPLATNFNYTGGANNLEIIIETNATGIGNEGSTGKQFRYSSPGSTQYYQYWNQDNTVPIGNGTLSSSRPNIQLHFVPTITSLGSASGCPGSSLVINGTNLLTATAVTIGGTAAAITANTLTSVTVTVGAGTTGAVSVTTSGGTANSGATTFTVNPPPAAIGGGAATVCTGSATPAFTDATAGGTWSITAGTGTASITAGGVVTGTTAGTVTVVYTLGTCTATKALTVNATPAAIGGGAATVCTALSTPAFTDATGGGTWSITPGTGTASITAGGVVTGTTAGTVTVVYTVGTCSVNTSLTVNQTPAAIGGGSATVCTGANTPAFTDATAGGTWSITAGTGTASITAGGVVTGTTAGTVTVVYTLGTCSTNTALTVLATPAITANPSNSAIAAGANTSFTTTASNAPTSYTWQVSTDGGGTWTTVTNGGVYTNATTATLNITAAPVGMNGYQYHVSATNACGTSAYSTAATLTVSLVYCTPVYSSSCNGSTITNVTFNTINNTSGCGNPNGTSFTDYSIAGVPTTSLLIGSAYNLTITTGASTRASAWIDYDQNGTFDPTEYTQIYTNAATGTVSITIPVTALTGVTKMRIRSRATAGTITSADPCTSFGSGEAEDYKITLVTPAPCVAPTAQPTTLVLTPPAGGTTINGSFTAAAPAPDNYLVVISTSAIPPTPVNGTTYTIGGTVETGGYSVVDTDNNTTFTATGLSPGTLYYVYVFSYSSLCTGGPIYNTTAPLNGSATTTTVVVGAYCTAATTLANNTLYINDVDFLGTLQDTNNDGTGFTTAPTAGYHDYTGLPTKSIQAQGEGVNVYVGAKTYRGHWKVWVDWNKDGDFLDTNELVYNSGSVATSTTTFGFIIPPTTAPGDYRIRIRVYNSFRNSNGAENYSLDYTPCETFDSYTGPNSTEYGEAEDYLFTVVTGCSAIIKTVTDGQTCGAGTVTLSATGSVGTTSYHWYTTATGGAAIAGATTSSYTTPVIASTTTYYVTADNGTCESLVRTAVVAKINPIPTLNFTPTTPEVCGENTIINLTASGDVEKVNLINENFEAGTLGVFTNNNIVVNGATLDGKSMWKNRTSTFVPAEQVWFPAISSGFGPNKFAMATSDIGTIAENALESAVLNSTGFLDLTLTFRIYFSSYLDGTDPLNDFVKVEVSTNGGGAWTVIDTYTTDQGFGTKFATKSYNLAAYINNANLKVRIHYYGNWTDGLAVDDIELYGNKPLNTAFNWSGASLPDVYSDAACTIPYVTGTPALTVWIKPTLAQLELSSYTFTASAILSNGCSASTPITVTNKSKIWKGTSSNDWNTASNWLPSGIPDANTCVVIPTGTTSKIINSPDALAKNLTIKQPTGNLELQAGKNLTVTDFINVETGATFNVRNNANLVQVNPVANTGNITMQRITNLKLFDYAYWSTPVGNGTFPVTSISPSTPSGYIFKWDPIAANSNGGQGNWINTTENMVLGKGYIVRGANGFNNATTSPLTANFIGVPNNGTYNVTIQRGGDLNAGTPGPNGVMRTIKDDNWNLVGNPYPSSIKALDFLTANLNIDGNVRIWTHNTLPTGAGADPFYGDYVLNYTPNDYIVHNGTGTTSGPAGFTGYIAAGQSFLVLMNDGAAGSSTVTFNNTMRNATYNNNQFYKTSSMVQVDDNIEKNRIWLDFVDQSAVITRTLVGYVTNATDDKDRLYDAITDYKNATNFYSILNDEIMTIQGKSLPFNNDDTIKLGFKASANGTNFKIAISAVDGIFSDASQNIYLEDKLLNVIHDLRSAPYTFTSNSGVYNDRFVLRYTNQTLSNTEFDYTNSVKIFASNRINVKSSNQAIKEVSVFDILGKTIFNRKNINASELLINELSPTNNVLIVKVILENNIEVIKKVVF